MYPIIQVSADASETPEQLGSKYKFWFLRQSAMFKLAREGTGEAWAEKIACELCVALGLPHARYDLATWRNMKGTTTANIVPERGRLVLGNELLGSFVPGYPGAQKYRQRQHTVSRVNAVVTSMRNLKMPFGVAPDHPLKSPFNFFVGYLLLDAWIGNTDRHHENWGIVVAADGSVHLAPTFDHASSLGRELTDEARLERLSTRDIRRNLEAYLAKAKSALYRSETDKEPLSPLDAFREVGKRSAVGKAYWLRQLAQVPDAELDRIIGEVPEEFMSSPARQFARALLQKNREALIIGARDS